MTPAINVLKKQQIAFELLSFQHPSGEKNYAKQAIQALGLPAGQVFKTLLFKSPHGYILALQQADQQVNIKQLANLAKVKKLELASPSEVTRETGYIIGAVSPIGQKKRLKTYLHSNALHHSHIYISAGKRGLEIKLSPKQLIALLCAQTGEF